MQNLISKILKKNNQSHTKMHKKKTMESFIVQWLQSTFRKYEN